MQKKCLIDFILLQNLERQSLRVLVAIMCNSQQTSTNDNPGKRQGILKSDN